MELTLEILAYAIVVGIGFAILLFLIGIILLILERRVIANRYEWLAVLSHYEWKGTIQIREEMKKLKKTKSMMSIMYIDLAHLEEERLIEHRQVVKKVAGYRITTREYRLTSSGTRKKCEVQREREQDLPDRAQIA